MAKPNEEHLEILNRACREGADVWNKWREDNPDIIPSLNEAKLWAAPLNRFNLSNSSMIEVDLRVAELRGASLVKADIHESNLDGVDLSGADLRNASLARIVATGANFSGANLTGACIKEWNINSETNLNGVICDYVYWEYNHLERRPHSRDFQPGEFTKLFQKALETVDIVFLDGIDWKAFLVSFLELKSK